MDLGLAGLIALVTGGSGGIGWQVADCFAAEGAGVAICARRAGPVAAAVERLRARGVPAFGQALDVADAPALFAWVEAAAAALGGIDIVVANVSAQDEGADEAAWAAAVAVDLMHSVRLVEAALPWLARSGTGSIVLVASVSAREAGPIGPAYGAIKAALIHHAKHLALRLAPQGIRANAVSPGATWVEGGAWDQIARAEPDRSAAALARSPLRRMARPEEIAKGIVFLASPASGFTTGGNLVIDGALTRGVSL